VAKETIKWHPAFVEALQLELEQYQDILEFKPEYQLNDEPLIMDVLVVKKVKDVVIAKNIGAIFKSDNVVEYKSPEDYVSVEDFYKVYGYACFYASLKKVDIREMTLTFVETRYPQKLLEHLQKVRKYEVEEREAGIYRVTGDIMPIQLIESKRLLPESNLWLKSLGNGLSGEQMRAVLMASRRYKERLGVGAYLYVLAAGNIEVMKEVGKMADQTLKEAMAEIGLLAKWEEEWEEKSRHLWEAQGEQKARQQGEATLQESERQRQELERQRQESERQRQDLERRLRQYETT
jgi:hypothetical protein